MKSGVIGIDIGGTNIKAALVTGRKISGRSRIATLAKAGAPHTIEQIKSAINPLRKGAHSIGIGIAGIIDSQHGVVKYSPNLKGWDNIPLAQIIRKEFNLPTHVLNDVDAICLGEWKYGVARGHDNVFLFTLGTGVGGAAICEGKLLFGANGFAGEFGHTTINYRGPRCVCGHRGHLERYVGAQYIVALAKKKMKARKSSLLRYNSLTPEIIAHAAKGGDDVACEVFAEIGYYIAVGIANILALFDPDIVVISGGIARAGRVLLDPVRANTRRFVMGANLRHYRIVAAMLNDDAGILGAALFAQSKRGQ